MNRHLLPTLGLLCLAAPAMAQIPNGGFEDWHTTGAFLEPDLWSTSNAVTYSLGTVLSCEKGTPGAVGASFAKVTTRDLGAFGMFPGLIHTGDQTIGSTGFPWSTRPVALNGQWQYHPQGSDQGSVVLSFTKWNTTTQTQDLIGAGIMSATSAMTSWQSFSATIVYYSLLDPDTANITLLSSAGNGVDGSAIWVDALSFGAPLEVQEQAGNLGFDIQPSPANDQLHITAAAPLAEVIVQDMSGRETGRETLSDISATVDVAHLPAGIYTARVRFADERVAVRRFIKN